MCQLHCLRVLHPSPLVNIRKMILDRIDLTQNTETSLLVSPAKQYIFFGRSLANIVNVLVQVNDDDNDDLTILTAFLLDHHYYYYNNYYCSDHNIDDDNNRSTLGSSSVFYAQKITHSVFVQLIIIMFYL